jgi:hypothetical protein
VKVKTTVFKCKDGNAYLELGSIFRQNVNDVRIRRRAQAQ